MDSVKTEFLGFDLVVANIPYNISPPLLAKLLFGTSTFRSVTLLLQKESARRLLARITMDLNSYLFNTISRPYSRSQLSEKLQRLRKKWCVLSTRLPKGIDFNRLTPHDNDKCDDVDNYKCDKCDKCYGVCSLVDVFDESLKYVKSGKRFCTRGEGQFESFQKIWWKLWVVEMEVLAQRLRMVVEDSIINR